MAEIATRGGDSISQVEVAAPLGGTSAPSADTRQRLRSEDVIINAPMSFTGAFQRTMRLRRWLDMNQRPWYVQAIWHWVFLNCILIVWWAVVAGWYLIFGIFLIPYRLLRRGARKRKAEALRHREMLGAIDKSARG